MGDLRQDPSTIPSVAILGCGRIGSELDEQGSPHVLTHAAACAANPGVHLAALCDALPDRLAAAGAARGVTALYDDPQDLFAHEAIDVAVVATPTALRTPVITAALEAGVRTFVLEKPLATTLEEAEAIGQTLRSAGAVVAVNYLRRFAPGLQGVRDRLRSGALGAIQYATIHYGKGLNNNGSHAIDLMRWWLGEPVSVRVTGSVVDGRDEDPTLNVRYEVQTDRGRVPVHLHGSDHRAVSLFEVDVLCHEGRIRMTDRGAQVAVSEVGADPAFPGYTALGPETTLDGGVTRALEGLWEDLVEVLRGRRSTPRCALSDGLSAMRVVAATRGAAATGETVTIPAHGTGR